MTRIARNPKAAAEGAGQSRATRCFGSVSFLAAVAFSAMTAVVGLTGHRPLMAAEAVSAWHPIEDIAATAEQFVIDRFGSAGARLTPEAGYLDPRLKLAECSEPLEGYMQDGAVLNARTVVGVRCEGEKPWKIFVPIRVVVTDSVAIAAKSLPADHTITMDDFVIEERDVSRQTAGYIADPADIIGKRLKRQVLPGRVIAPSMLLGQILIERGQTVTITAQTGGVSIEMAGTALMDGTANERIRVENSVSKRVIEAIVRSPEHVEVLVN